MEKENDKRRGGFFTFPFSFYIIQKLIKFLNIIEIEV